ncbi:hypothetical protein FRC11_014110 [Ceratobasidium sp. 423]|nr:hypothetical protein FRC11_014110 [Ceratobasidium sp. 423]
MTPLCEPVHSYYQLKNLSTHKEHQDMKDKDMDKHVDPYEGKILFEALQAIFFWGPKAIGAKKEDDTKDLEEEQKHLAMLAYLATMIQFCLREWSKGYFKKGTLNAMTQQSVWVCHFNGLKNVSSIAHKQLIKMYDEWVQKA